MSPLRTHQWPTLHITRDGEPPTASATSLFNKGTERSTANKDGRLLEQIASAIAGVTSPKSAGIMRGTVNGGSKIFGYGGNATWSMIASAGGCTAGESALPRPL